MVIKEDCTKKITSKLEKSLELENADLAENSFENCNKINSDETKKVIVEKVTYENNAPCGPEDTVISDMIRRYTEIHGLPDGYNPYK